MENLKIERKEDLHFSLPITTDNPLIANLIDVDEMKDLQNKYQLDFESSELNIFKGLPGYVLVIPTLSQEANEEKFVAVYYTGHNQIKNIKVMTLVNTGESDFRISFSNASEDQTVTGVFRDGEYIKTIVEGNSGQFTTQSLLDCLDQGFSNLPWALQVFCIAACGAIWTGVGLAACAGCLAGLGINCD